MTKLDFEMAVRRALREKDMTVKSLAEKLEISVVYCSDIIRGNRKAEHMRKKIYEILDLRFKI